MAGVAGVNGSKLTLELDFRRAWRGWPYARRFPTIKAGPAYDDVLHVLGKSGRRRGPIVAEWDGQWPFVPVLLQDWTHDEIAELIDEEIPADAWRDLVTAWLGPDRT